jgi:plastocyanin
MFPSVRKPLHHRLMATAAGLVAVLVLSACGSDRGVGQEGRESLSEGQLISAKSADGHKLREVPVNQAPTVELELAEDPVAGWNVHVVTEDFEFTPERLDGVAPQEGHAHLFLDGEKIARLYGPWYHLSDSVVPSGEHELSVSLNANDHTIWAVNGEPIGDSTTVTGTAESEEDHGDGYSGHHGGTHPDEKQSHSGDDSLAEPEASEPADDAPSFTVVNGKVTGPNQIEVNVGDTIAFTVKTDAADEVHVHGYDTTVPVKPGKAATVRLQADIPGVFEVELEESHLQLTQLRVTG